MSISWFAKDPIKQAKEAVHDLGTALGPPKTLDAYPKKLTTADVMRQDLFTKLAGLRVSIDRASRTYKRTGKVDASSVYSIRFSLTPLLRALLPMVGQQKPDSQQANEINSRYVVPRGLGDPISRLKAAIGRMERQAEEGKYPHVEIRKALDKLNKRLASRITNREIDHWLDSVPGLDADDPAHLERLATIIALGSVPDQTWEVRYRSRAPGRSLVLLASYITFPDWTELSSVYRPGDMDGLLYIAATRPKWQIVLVISLPLGRAIVSRKRH